MKRLPKQDPSQIQISDFGGLDLQPDVLSRPVNSWQIAQNVDLFTPGSMRKIVGPNHAYGGFAAPLVEMFNYLRSTANTLQILGVGSNGHLYDVVANSDLATLGAIGSPPWIGQFNGNVSGTNVTYVVAALPGNPPVKWESSTGVTAIGVSAPAAAVAISPASSATNSNAYLMQAGIQYLWTYFNPTTLHESSPSAVTSGSIMTPTANTPPAATPYTTQVQLTITTPAPSVGSGYTRIRVYRTRDGGATFYLLPAAYNSGGSNLLDGNFSAAIQGATTVLYDGVTAHNIAPAQDQLLVNPPGGAPAIGANDPPPNATWGAVYQNRLWLIDGSGKRLWFSNLGDFESYGVDSFLDFSKEINDSIRTLMPLSDRMIIFGRNSSRQITGTDFSDFVQVPIDMRRGILGRRAATNDGDVVYALTPESVARLSFAESGPPFVGDRVKPLTDQITDTTWIQMEIDSTRGQMLFAMSINAGTYNNQILITDLSRESPFTVIAGLSSDVAVMRELENPSTTVKDLYVSLADGNVYLLHGGSGTLTATLQTQPLPLDEFDIWRVYKWLELFGSDLYNWQFSWSIGYPNPATGEMQFSTFSTPVPVGIPLGRRRVPIGGNGRQIILKFTHSVNNGTNALISKLNLPYEDKVSG